MRPTGYRHNPFQHCPQGDLHKKGKCWCNPKENFGEYLAFGDDAAQSHACADIDALTTDYEWYSCLKRYDALF